MKTTVFLLGIGLMAVICSVVNGGQTKHHHRSHKHESDSTIRQANYNEENPGENNDESPQIVLQDNTIFPSDGVEESTNCQVGGFWYNPHGSELFLHQARDGSLRGEFRTAVETECGSAGSNFTQIKGHVHGRLVTFQAFFRSTNGRRSTTSWVGQCHKECNHHLQLMGGTGNNGQNMLHTTWVITTEEESCDMAWGQNRIGQDIFTRHQIMKHGPRKSQGTHLPKRPSTSS